MRRIFQSLFAIVALAATPSCAVYDAPPEVTIEGAVDGLLTDPTQPIVLRFSEPVDPDTLSVKLARDVLDVEGNLADEVDPPGELDLFFTHKPGLIDDLGTSELLDNNTTFVIHTSAAMPIGPRLVLILEKGLSDREGNKTEVRRRVRFGYQFDLSCDAPVENLRSGKFFMLVDVDKPLSVQVQLFADFVVDPLTGSLLAQFTNADRNKATTCPSACPSTEVCRLLPEPACVAPSERAGTPDEFSDFVPNSVPPTGYSFSGNGCAVDQPDGSAAFTIAPVDVIVQQPPVTLRNARMTAAFADDGTGVLRATGSLSSDDVLLNGNSSGRGEGGLAARSMTDEEAPEGIPTAPEKMEE